MPVPRLLALDLDGTLMRSDNTLSPANARAVARARDAGWRVVLATGKPPWAIAHLAERLDLAGPHVVANGAAVWSADEGTRTLAEIPRPDALRALAFAARRERPRAVSGPHGVFCERHWGVAEVAAAMAEVGEEPPSVVEAALEAEPTLWKVITVWPAGAGAPSAPALTTARWVRTARPFYEAVPAAATKASGLRRLAAAWGVPRQAVVAIGDSDNDLELLRWAGLGIAMGQAPAHVRAAADRVTAANDEDGVAQAVTELLDGGR